MKKQESSLSQKEMLFVKYFLVTRSYREAAARAGYLLPERSGIKLISEKKVRGEIEKQSKRHDNTGEIADGLRRIAFGGIADAIRLMLFDDITGKELEEMDLFSVSEIKRPKGGGMEIKFFDRIKALEALSKLCIDGDNDSAEPFYRAIEEGAKKLGEDKWGELGGV